MDEVGMFTDQQNFLNLKEKPARLSRQEVAWMLRFTEDDITMLVSAGALKPLGKPAKNAPKWFARVDIERLKENAAWLARATEIVRKAWEERNKSRKKSSGLLVGA